MKNKLTRLLCFAVALALIAAGAVIFSSAENGTGSENYCYSALAALPNGAVLQYAYERIYEGVEEAKAEISVYDGFHPISKEELSIAYDAYIRDHAEHFWLDKSYTYTYTELTVMEICPTYLLEGEALQAARAEFDAKLKSLSELCDGATSEFQKEQILHDALAARIEYAEGSNAHNAYGALVEGRAVCEGYAEALQCLLRRVGIQSVLVIGSSVNPATGQPEGHEWNIVKIDGKYYHVDLTWNDQGTELYHAYFNLTEERIKEDHQIDKTAFALPSCIATEANYFNVRGGAISTYTVEEIAELLKGNALSARVYLNCDRQEFLEWFYANIVEIAAEAGVSGQFKYGYSGLGRELILNIEACAHTSLTHIPPVKGNCTTDTVIEHYLCECGRIFLDAEAERAVVDRDSVYVKATGHVLTEQTEDEAHLRSKAQSCLEFDTYYYGCKNCDFVSTSSHYASKTAGEHTPGPEATTENAQICLICQIELAPKIHVHRLKKVNKVEPTCTESGKSEYYLCDCGAAFRDAEGKFEIANAKGFGILPSLGHTVPAEDGKCERCGTTLSLLNSDTVTVIIAAAVILAVLAVVIVIVKKIRG